MAEPTPGIERLFAGLQGRTLSSTLFNMAHAYARVSDASWDLLATTNDADFAAPSIMCQCFAIELLLKFFVVADNPQCRTYADLDAVGVNTNGHKLAGLFERVSPVGQDRIAAHLFAPLGRKASPADFKSALLKLGGEPFVQ